MNNHWNRADKKLPLLNQPVIALVVGLEGLQDVMRVDFDEGWLWCRNSDGFNMFNAKYGEYMCDDEYLVSHWMLPPEKPIEV